MDGLAQPLHATVLVLACKSNRVTDRLLLTNASQRESALNTAPLAYPHCGLLEGSTLTRMVVSETKSLAYKLRNKPAGESVARGRRLAKASHRLSELKRGTVLVST